MKVTIVGSGDAFGTGARAHSCFRVDCAAGTAIVDFGASSITSWKRLGLKFDDVDLIVISHLHGDHFGGLPFLLLDCQFVERRARPLLLVGPPGFEQRLRQACEVFFPGRTQWSFPWRAEEIAPGVAKRFGGFSLETRAVVHSPGQIATGLRLTAGAATLAYSGDTAWTDALIEIAAGADLFICECYSGDAPVPHHLDWPTLEANLARFSAKRIAITHMSASALARELDMKRAGLSVVHDGQIFDLAACCGHGTDQVVPALS